VDVVQAQVWLFNRNRFVNLLRQLTVSVDKKAAGFNSGSGGISCLKNDTSPEEREIKLQGRKQ
jgi:hypothetical protein